MNGEPNATPNATPSATPSAAAIGKSSAVRATTHQRVVALLGCTLLAAASGALYNTDRFWGDPVVYAVHQAAGWSLAVLVPLHLIGVALTSWRQRENLVAARWSGRKRVSGGCSGSGSSGGRSGHQPAAAVKPRD